MRSVLIILLNLILVGMIVLILLKFRFDRVGLRVDMSWRSVRLLLCTLAEETLEYGENPEDEREKIKAFVKSKKQAKQIACANELKSFLAIPEEDAPELAMRCKRYNDAVKQFNEMREKPLWHFVATVFRIKPQPMLETFDSNTRDDVT